MAADAVSDIDAMRLRNPVWPAPAKLNLMLHITGRRADGYHELQTVFQFLDLCDEVQFNISGDGRIRRLTGLADIPVEDDLVVRSARALQQASGTTRGVDILLDKRIPAGAGLGGGSSDAATTLHALNRLWKLDFDIDRLADIGLGLGADVPVFVRGFAAFAEGIDTGTDENKPHLLVMGTLGKAFGSFGAFVAGSGEWIETLIQHARTYIYTTALPPAQAAVSLAALDIVRNEPWRREHLSGLIRRFRSGCHERGIRLMPSATPIQPVLIGDNQRAIGIADHLRTHGILAFAIRQPTVAAGIPMILTSLLNAPPIMPVNGCGNGVGTGGPGGAGTITMCVSVAII